MFERLYVAGHQPVRAEAGSGLGLAIVHQLVEAMGGVVGPTSPLGGARLEVRFPVVPVSGWAGPPAETARPPAPSPRG